MHNSATSKFHEMHQNNIRVAVILPCFNEGATIAAVVSAFALELPRSEIYVCDNNSTDNTIDEARRAGAIIRTEARQGKGSVLRRMFADIEADVYLIADGDLTYDAKAAPVLIRRLVTDNLDMVVGRRIHKSAAAYRRGHVLGNMIFTKIVQMLFNSNFQDIFSGFRAFSRRYVKSFPLLSHGFEVETEMAIHALSLQMATAEIDTTYLERPPGSASKLSTFKDGVKIMMRIFVLLKNEKPLWLFSVFGLLCAGASLMLGAPVVATFIDTGLVERLPTAVLAASLMIISMGMFGLGIGLDSLCRFRAEARRLSFLAHSSPAAVLGQFGSDGILRTLQGNEDA